MSKLYLLAGLGVGYVLGSKAGREQYRKIAEAARHTWEKPAVRKAAQRVDSFVDEKAPALHSVAETVLGKGDTSGAQSGASSDQSSGAESGGQSGGTSTGDTGQGGHDQPTATTTTFQPTTGDRA